MSCYIWVLTQTYWTVNWCKMMILCVMLLPWVLKLFVSDPGVSCLLSALKKCSQANLSASNWSKLSDLLQFLKTLCYTFEIFERIWNILNLEISRIIHLNCKSPLKSDCLKVARFINRVIRFISWTEKQRIRDLNLSFS